MKTNYKDIKMILDTMDSEAIAELQKALKRYKTRLFYCASLSNVSCEGKCEACDDYVIKTKGKL